jgi:hypothetical protein
MREISLFDIVYGHIFKQGLRQKLSQSWQNDTANDSVSNESFSQSLRGRP